MPKVNENLEKLVQYARDKKPTDFKALLTTEIGSRIATKVADIKTNLSKTMFTKVEEGTEDEVEHTHDDGTTHTHAGGDKEHVHEGELPPALKKAIAAKKAGKKDDDDDDEDEKEEDTKTEGELPPALKKAIDAKKKDKDDDDDEESKDENLKNFKGKKAKPFEKEKKESVSQINTARNVIMQDPMEAKIPEGSKEAYQKFFNSKLAKYKVKSPSQLDDATKKKFFAEIEKEWKGEDE